MSMNYLVHIKDHHFIKKMETMDFNLLASDFENLVIQVNSFINGYEQCSYLQNSEQEIKDRKPVIKIRVGMTISDIKLRFIEATFYYCHGNCVQTAQILRLSKDVVYHTINEYQIKIHIPKQSLIHKWKWLLL